MSVRQAWQRSLMWIFMGLGIYLLAAGMVTALQAKYDPDLPLKWKQSAELAVRLFPRTAAPQVLELGTTADQTLGAGVQRLPDRLKAQLVDSTRRLRSSIHALAVRYLWLLKVLRSEV